MARRIVNQPTPESSPNVVVSCAPSSVSLLALVRCALRDAAIARHRPWDAPGRPDHRHSAATTTGQGDPPALGVSRTAQPAGLLRCRRSAGRQGAPAPMD